MANHSTITSTLTMSVHPPGPPQGDLWTGYGVEMTRGRQRPRHKLRKLHRLQRPSGLREAALKKEEEKTKKEEEEKKETCSSSTDDTTGNNRRWSHTGGTKQQQWSS
eukprot:11720971-Karenia_brevis.AAC.1